MPFYKNTTYGFFFQLIDPYYVMSFPIHMVIILGPLIAINCIPNLKALAPFSVVANILTFIGLGIVLYYLVAGTKTTKPLDYWGSISTFPLFFGTVLFALTAVGVVSEMFFYYYKFYIKTKTHCVELQTS